MHDHARVGVLVVIAATHATKPRTTPLTPAVSRSVHANGPTSTARMGQLRQDHAT